MSCATSRKSIIAGGVAQLIIHRFEVIEVEENHGEGVPEPMKGNLRQMKRDDVSCHS